METLIIILLGLLGATVLSGAVAVLLVLLGLRQLRRRNRVSRDEPGDAPLLWLWSPARAARLHRRLRSANWVGQVIRARHAGDAYPPASVDLARTLERATVALDHRLTLLGRLAPHERRRLFPQLMAEVRRLEQMASDLSMLDLDAGVQARLPHERSAMDDLADGLRHQQVAREELRAIEADVGLHRDSLPQPPRPTPRSTPGPGSPTARRARG